MADDRFGISVSVSGNYAVVAACVDDDDDKRPSPISHHWPFWGDVQVIHSSLGKFALSELPRALTGRTRRRVQETTQRRTGREVLSYNTSRVVGSVCWKHLDIHART